ncbi:polyamine ABC transporter substrate-binding protein [Roseospira visakhapatnamensis]|uniref:Putative spermidine/putrescine transport system substrate-binding protein n=1 Tax=Roseospira visakhapatnamensis TaxID=390880 RepID=A0A7W6W8T1_9PROT|nr:polyamine ABC transporter substrate-binding protein [Roseospira visakhapatnamensis]MBB4264741.1 putative spermidine/putrescine transport system substrate-binding protein [Roseospira visakhapatnamensis]
MTMLTRGVATRTRRTVLGIGALAVAGAGFAIATQARAEALNVVCWGGAYTKSQQEAYYTPWEELTGHTINSIDYDGNVAPVKAQVESGNVTWDVVDVELSDAIKLCDEGLVEVLPLEDLPPAPDGTPAAEDFIEGTLHDCAVASIVWTNIYAYDETKFPDEKPSTIADLFDVDTFPGKRGLRRFAKANLEMALMADGVPAADVYDVLSTPEGVDRAFAVLDRVKDHVVWWEAGAQPPQMLADGEVVMATAYNGRMFNAMAVENKPFKIVWDGQVWDMDLFVIPKGAPNKTLAWEFIKFATATEQLARQAEWISYGPARASSVPLIGTHAEAGIEMGPHMPTAPENFQNALQNDFLWWADHADEMNERFNAWLAQ